MAASERHSAPLRINQPVVAEAPTICCEGQVRDLMLQFLIGPPIVRVEKTDVLPRSGLERPLTYARDVPRVGKSKDPQPTIRWQLLQTFVSGTVVGDDGFPIANRLSAKTFDCFEQERPAVVRRQDDTDTRHGHILERTRALTAV
jgi:hypothetical protein